jgi:hypothetical protein
MIDFIAHTQSRVVKPSGEEGLYQIGVSTPVQQKTGEYGCQVCLPDAIEPRTIYGEDSLQALSLAMRFMADRIDDMIAKSWKFYFGDSDDRFPFEAYFIPAAWTQKLEAMARDAEKDKHGTPVSRRIDEGS